MKLWEQSLTEDQHFLGTQHEMEDGSVKIWVWTVLVLGVRDAVHIFTRIIAPIMGDLRKKAIKGQIYIDDLITADATKRRAMEVEKKAKNLFERCGWVFQRGEKVRRAITGGEISWVGDKLNGHDLQHSGR